MFLKTATARNMFAIVFAGVLTTVATAGVLLWLSYRAVEERSISEMRNAAKTSAANVETFFANATTLGRNMRTALHTEKATGNPSREAIDRLFKRFLEDSPFAVGISTGWEPNAFDGKDNEFVNAPGHDATGRFVPYFSRKDGKAFEEPLADYETPGLGDYYIIPRRTGKDLMTEPYIYPVNGKDVFMTSFMAPLLFNGKFGGVIGVDIALDSLSADLAKLKPLGEGYIALLSKDGHIVSHPDAKTHGKALKESGLDAAAWQSLIDNPGVARELIDAAGTRHIMLAVPAHVLTDTTWFTIVSVPKSVLFAHLSVLAITSIAVIALAAGLMVAIGWLLAARFGRRLNRVISATSEIAEGRTDVDLSESRHSDEIGEMARSLGVLRDATIAKMRLENEAERNRALSDEERAIHAAEAVERENETRAAVEALAEGLQKLADGDMTHRIEKTFAGSLDQLRHDFNASLEKLQSTLSAVNSNAEAIRSGSEEIRTASDDLARRTEQQAASVEETAAALEEITTSLKDATRRADEAGQLIVRTRAGAAKSGEVVRRAVEAMGGIENSSREISSIISVIDEIAFQTNLLALNAGVEAARAGSAGKGFAVVAQEVRELAQRSASAAKEIKTLITKSGEQVHMGVALVGETGVALTEILDQVQEIDRNVTAIVRSSHEQTQGLGEINSALNAIDQGTQQNAAMVEQQTAASHALANEVAALNRLIAQFRLGRLDATALRTVNADERDLRPVLSGARALGNRLGKAFGMK